MDPIFYSKQNEEDNVGFEFVKEFHNITKKHMINTINSQKRWSLQNNKSELSYKVEKVCHICGEPFLKNAKVRDHCHFTSKYREAAHSDCNLKCGFS